MINKNFEDINKKIENNNLNSISKVVSNGTEVAYISDNKA